ncbi:MAG TPA: HAMP domain-containing sensor histidine kinase [Candidatus Limnocylindria bacterium]|jgi:signal transduction histidine kinase
MHSAKSDLPPEPRVGRVGGQLAWFKQLNARLVLALASVALVALLVSGLALNQVLPGYFKEQATSRARTAALATAVYLQEQALSVGADRPELLLVRELRETQFLTAVAERAAKELAQGTVTIYNADANRTTAAQASPDAETAATLRSEGLRPDADVPAQQFSTRIQLPDGSRLELLISVTAPYTSRVATLDRVRSTLLFTGLLALIASLLVGIAAARRFTAPLARLRRAASRLAQGQLDERAPRSEIVEIDDLARQFNVMADRLSESLRMLEADRDRLREFVADVSHELRTPIAALRAFTELQRDGVDEATRREFLDRSSEQISRLDWMSTNLLDLSRIDAGIFPLDVRPGDLRDPIRSVVEAHAELAEQRGVSLTSEVPPAPVMLPFDRERIVQLLSNLIGNGLKFTPRGGQVGVALSDHPEGAVLEVRDSGPGILATELPHVFERFFRGTNVGDARASGSGLGLAIARSIVEMHGGQIEVASAIGEGSAFTVRLPRVAPVPQGQ